jgi:hypothetical protein
MENNNLHLINQRRNEVIQYKKNIVNVLKQSQNDVYEKFKAIDNEVITNDTTGDSINIQPLLGVNNTVDNTTNSNFSLASNTNNSFNTTSVGQSNMILNSVDSNMKIGIVSSNTSLLPSGTIAIISTSNTSVILSTLQLY